MEEYACKEYVRGITMDIGRTPGEHDAMDGK